MSEDKNDLSVLQAQDQYRGKDRTDKDCDSLQPYSWQGEGESILSLIDGLMERGIVPKSVRVGTIEVHIASVERKKDADAQESQGAPRSYRALALANRTRNDR